MEADFAVGGVEADHGGFGDFVALGGWGGEVVVVGVGVEGGGAGEGE